MNNIIERKLFARQVRRLEGWPYFGFNTKLLHAFFERKGVTIDAQSKTFKSILKSDRARLIKHKDCYETTLALILQ